MEKETKFKLKIPSFLTSSCKTQNLSEVIDHNKDPIVTPQNLIFLQPSLVEHVHDDEENEPFHNIVKKPKKTSSSSSSTSYNASATSASLMCKPRCPETFDQMVRENCIIAGNNFPRRKITGKYSMLSPSGDFSGRRCPPASPTTPMFQQQWKKKKKKKKKKVKEKRRLIRSNDNNNDMKNIGSNPSSFSHSSSNETDNGDMFSSDDEREEDEKENIFSLKSISLSSKSISLSSDSDTSYRTQTQARPRPRRRKPGSSRPRREVGVVSMEEKVKDTFAVVKSSSDPYNDFRTSMVEMIIEKQIFGAKELEQLLNCFLSLNFLHHHKVIVEVFSDICDALFSYCS